MDKLENNPNTGNFSKNPYKDKNSPMKFKLKGTPQLLKANIKKNIENMGII
jgi:hypothetical protein